MTLSASLWPASVKRSTSTCPEVSLDSSRVSETVNTAIDKGIKALPPCEELISFPKVY